MNTTGGIGYEGYTGISVEVEVTAKFTWTPDAATPDALPPDKSYFLETGTAYAGDFFFYDSGSPEAPEADNGLDDDAKGDPDDEPPFFIAYYRTSYGSHWQEQSGEVITFTHTLSANLNGDFAAGSGGVFYSVQMFPIDISLIGAYPTADGLKMLTGQRIDASLSGSAPIKPGTYQWSSTGDTFKDYDINKTNDDQLVPLGDDDKNQAGFLFYDKKKDDTVKVTCSATLLSPSGEEHPITVESKSITVLKPSVSFWGITPGFVQFNGNQPNPNGGPNLQTFGLYADPNGSYTSGMAWHDVAISVPSPFSGGSGTFTQMILPERGAYTGSSYTSLDPKNGLLGLDGSFQYGPGWTLPATGNDGDSPAFPVGYAGQAQGNSAGFTKFTANDTLTTWVMYKPPSVGTGTVWVPLQKYSWTWSADMTWQTNQWNLTASFPSSTGTPPSYTGQDTDDPPQWNVVH